MVAQSEHSGRRLLAAAVFFGVVAALVLGEVVLRLLQPPQLSKIRYPCIYRPDPATGFRYEPGARGVVAGHFEIENEVVMNSLGFYDDEPLPDDRVGARILAVGDSFTAAMNVPRSEVWTSVLEAELRRSGYPRADVVNIGIDGTGTDVHLELLRRYVPRFEPDVVLVAFFANEVVDVLPDMVRALERDGRTPADLFFVHDNHLNAYGNRLFGRAVARTLTADREPGRR